MNREFLVGDKVKVKIAAHNLIGTITDIPNSSIRISVTFENQTGSHYYRPEDLELIEKP